MVQHKHGHLYWQKFLLSSPQLEKTFKGKYLQQGNLFKNIGSIYSMNITKVIR